MVEQFVLIYILLICLIKFGNPLLLDDNQRPGYWLKRRDKRKCLIFFYLQTPHFSFIFLWGFPSHHPNTLAYFQFRIKQ